MKHIKDSQSKCSKCRPPAFMESTLTTLRQRPLPARLAVVPVSRNFFNSLFTLDTDQPLVGNSRISILAP